MNAENNEGMDDDTNNQYQDNNNTSIIGNSQSTNIKQHHTIEK